MTKQELNRDIKRLLKKAASMPTDTANVQNEYIQNILRPEFKRLYLADREFAAMNRTNILIMLRLNLRYRFEPLHYFGIHIDLPGIY